MKASSYHAVYDAGIPPTLRLYPDCTLLGVVRDTARERPRHPALLFKGARLSYRTLERLSDAFASALVAQGVYKGDRVALLLPNCPQAVIAQLGAWKAGAVDLVLKNVAAFQTRWADDRGLRPDRVADGGRGRAGAWPLQAWRGGGAAAGRRDSHRG